jgi:hypothetical protein
MKEEKLSGVVVVVKLQRLMHAIDLSESVVKI